MERYRIHAAYGLRQGILIPVVFSIVFITNPAQFIVGIWLPLWTWSPVSSLFGKRHSHRGEKSEAREEHPTAQDVEAKRKDHRTIWLSALLLGAAMVARGEIGLLIIEIGYNETSYVSEEGLITGVWAILLNTIIGPATVGILVKYCGQRIGNGEWGLQEPVMPTQTGAV